MLSTILTIYQQNLLIAYLVGVCTQITTLFIISTYIRDDLKFSPKFAVVYVMFAFMQFMCFLKLIGEKDGVSAVSIN
jgi:hypothetical protein